MEYTLDNSGDGDVILRFAGQFGNGQFTGWDRLSPDEATALASALLSESATARDDE
jgi:hypothetical protein